MGSGTFVFGLVAGLLTLRTAIAQSSASAPTVTLDAGVVVGTAVSIPLATPVAGSSGSQNGSQNGTTGSVVVNEYLGIPYAQSPPLRFAPPSSAQSWSSPLQATQYKPICTQEFLDPPIVQNFTEMVFNNPGGPTLPESEDCLYINVFAPASRSPPSGRAVMFWIYGGGLEFGGSSNGAYNGTSFAANQNVVLVTFNYRTNVFGFPSSPEIPAAQQNVGLLDQRFALQWVQDNIASFGGSPDQVTIFGESAGGYSVKQLVALPPNPLPFRAAILESEATESSPTGPAAWQSLATALNCSNSTSELACVRAAPATTIKNIIETQELEFNPTNNNVTAIADTTSIWTNGGGARVPFLIGTNANEGRPFAYEAILVAQNLTLDEYLSTIIPSSASSLQQQIEAAYPISQYGSAYFQIAAVITDSTFQCPAAKIANLAAASGQYDVWRYYFNASFPNTQTFQGAGVYHSSEIPEVFGTYPVFDTTDQEIALSQYMQGAWASFAKNPTQGPGWPKIGSNNGVELGALGSDGSFGETTIPLSTVDSICSVWAGVLDLEGI